MEVLEGLIGRSSCNKMTYQSIVSFCTGKKCVEKAFEVFVCPLALD